MRSVSPFLPNLYTILDSFFPPHLADTGRRDEDDDAYIVQSSHTYACVCVYGIYSCGMLMAPNLVSASN